MCFTFLAPLIVGPDNIPISPYQLSARLLMFADVKNEYVYLHHEIESEWIFIAIWILLSYFASF